MLVLVGESGSGKSTIEKKLIEIYGLDRIISYTTRMPRDGEVNGIDYKFTPISLFENWLEHGFFAEHTVYNNNYYGIAKTDCLDESISVVDVEGLKQLKQHKELNIVAFHIYLPEEIRKQRMLERGDGYSDVLERLENDREAFKHISQYTNYTLFNECLDTTIENIWSLFSKHVR